MKGKITLFLLSCMAALTAHAQIKIISSGDGNQIQYDLKRGTYDVVHAGVTMIKDAYAVCRSGDRADSSTAYSSRQWSIVHRNGQKVYQVRLSDQGRPEMVQEFAIDKKSRIFTTLVMVKAKGCNYMSPLT